MLQTIKNAIVVAHDELGNKSAISVKGMEDAGVTISEQTLQQWSNYCEKLRDAAVAYNKASHDKNSSDRTLSTLQGKVWAAWREVLKEGTEDEFDKNFFVRKGDVVHICGLCAEYFQNSAKGKCVASHTKTDFRRNIETLIGVRMAGNGLLSDDDKDLIKAYEKAVSTIKSRTDLLEGYKKGTENIPGLKTVLNGKRAKLSKMQEKIAVLKLSKEEADDFLIDLLKPVEDLEKQVKAYEKDIEDAKKVKADKEKTYNALMDRLNFAGLNA